MKRKHKIIIGLVIFVLIAGMACGLLMAYKLYKHERAQSQQISELIGQVEFLDERLTQSVEYYDFQPEYRQDSFNYFAIGNSLTLIKSWGRGICSTEPDNDYFNLVKKSLENEYGEVVAYPYNFSPWERLSNRDRAFALIDPYLSEELDLITIQLGENVSDTTTYESDLESLISYVHEKSPNATIVVIGDWWSIDKNEMRKTAAANTGVLFVDLEDLIGDKSYQSSTGIVCNKSDGTTVTVSEAASTHPGDKGMKEIADRIISALKLQN